MSSVDLLSVSDDEIVTFAALPHEKRITFSSMIGVQVAPLSAMTFVHRLALSEMAPLETFGVDDCRDHRGEPAQRGMDLCLAASSSRSCRARRALLRSDKRLSSATLSR